MIIGVVSDLVGQVVSVGCNEYQSTTVAVRGRVRAVTANQHGDLRLWVEELIDTECSKYFGYGVPGPPRSEVPGNIISVLVGYEMTVTIHQKKKKES